MARRISFAITMAGAALMLGASTALAEPGTHVRPAQVQAEGSSSAVVPSIAPFGGNKRAVVTAQEPARAATAEATSSGSELQWSQIGLGFGIGVVLMIGLYLLARGTRDRQLAH